MNITTKELNLLRANGTRATVAPIKPSPESVLLREVADSLVELLHRKTEPPQVTVEAPDITVESPDIKVEAPKVTVSPKIELTGPKRPTEWRFELKRDRNGKLEEIVATAK